ncbi:uncharacterized protein isoform X1 [Rhodnius prolixus]|uniref:uncharacterized protein isoform X1 n=1 Tax=Rhodnius prolixus TaxID=13249 RepID=UPI003D18DFBB
MYYYRLVFIGAILPFIVTITVNAATHQRFSNLNRLLNHLDGSTELPPTSTVPTTSAPHRIRHTHWQQHFDNSFQQQFDSLNSNNNNNNGNINNNKELVPFDEDEDEEDETLEDPQPQEEQLQSDIRHRLPFTTSIGKSEFASKSHRKIFDKKYRFSMPPVKMTGGEQDPRAYEEYHKHHTRMREETKCKIPQPKIVRVSDHYPSGTKTYQPSCIKLYRCDEDTGCCEGNRRCGVKTSKKVEFHFHVGTEVPYYTGTRHIIRTASRVEKLQFYNHTECECHDRNDEMPRDTIAHKLQSENTYNRCKCPSEYTVRNLANGSCSCDCFDKQRDCTKYKKGKEYFNHQDRLCIETRVCTVPACDFGAYIRRSGRCPKKYEKYRAWPGYKP